MPKTLVGVNARGYRVGEDHHAAKLSDHEVELVFELIEAAVPYKEIADKMECSVDLIKSIATGRVRAQRPVRWKTVVLKTVPGVKAGRRSVAG